MAILLSNKSKFLIMLTIILLGLFSLTLFAQDKEGTKSKLDQLKGKVEKITIKVDGKDVVFEGKEAEKLAKQLRQKGMFNVFTSGNGKMSSNGKVKVYAYSNPDDEEDAKDGKVEKKINVEVKDGKKIVVVTTDKDGKEETKTYEGEDAEKLLKEEKGMKHFSLSLGDDEDMSKCKVMVLGGDYDDENCCCCKGKMMMKMHSGKGMKHFIIKEFDDDKDKKEEKSEKK
jgi:hypothetical protein